MQFSSTQHDRNGQGAEFDAPLRYCKCWRPHCWVRCLSRPQTPYTLNDGPMAFPPPPPSFLSTRHFAKSHRMPAFSNTGSQPLLDGFIIINRVFGAPDGNDSGINNSRFRAAGIRQLRSSDVTGVPASCSTSGSPRPRSLLSSTSGQLKCWAALMNLLSSL